MNFLKSVRDFICDPFGIKRIKKLTGDLAGTNVLVEILKEEAEEAKRIARTTHMESHRNAMMLQMYKAQSVINREIDNLRGKRYLSHEGRKALYQAVSKDLDPDGVILFQAAQDILGNFEETTFPYEANHGFFEGNILGSKGSFQALLIQYADKLGQPKNLNRWKPVQNAGGYEECVDWSIDETTPEYIAFERDLYAKVFRYFYAEPVPFIPISKEEA